MVDGVRWTNVTQPAGPASPASPAATFGTDSLPHATPSEIGRAGASLALGITGSFMSFYPVLGLGLGAAAVILAIVSLRNITAARSRRQGLGLAIAGLILGCTSLLSVPAALILTYS